jgi:hypothetical protein
MTMESPAPEVKPKAANSPRVQSEVDFPYADLEGAEELARSVDSAGGGVCESEQLAAALGMEAKGGGFRLRVLTAKTFGIINYERGGRISLTDVGKRLLDPQQQRAARVDAFLAVELYLKVYEEFKGRPLPPIAGLDRALVTMGVGEKVKEKARQVLMRSAKHAGFFELASDRLTKPVMKQEQQKPPGNEGDSGRGGNGQNGGENNGGGGGGGGGGDKQHPLIAGLVMMLPAVGTTDWPAQNRVNWLNMAAGIIKNLYAPNDPEDIEIKIKKP